MDICGSVLVSKDALKFGLKCLYCEIDVEEWEAFVSHIQSLHYTDEEPCIDPTVQLNCKKSIAFEWLKEETVLAAESITSKDGSELKIGTPSPEEVVKCERMDDAASENGNDSDREDDGRGSDGDMSSTDEVLANDKKLLTKIFKPTFVRQNANTSMFIEIFEKSSCLWNPYDENYGNKTACANSKKEIIKEMKKRCQVSLNNKTLWESLRVLYTWYKTTAAVIDKQSESKTKKLSATVMRYFEKCSFLTATKDNFLDSEDVSPNIDSPMEVPVTGNGTNSDYDDGAGSSSNASSIDEFLPKDKKLSRKFKPTFAKQNANTSVFIEIFEKSSCLWNPNDDNYKNNTARVNSRKKIIKEMKKRCQVSLNNKTLLESLRVLYTRYQTTASAIEKQSESKRKKLSAIVMGYFEKCSFLSATEADFLDIEDDAPTTNSNLSFATLNSTTIAFIETYARFPSLYDPNHEDYTLVLERKQKYKEMANILKIEHNIEFSNEEIYKGIYYLRHWYFKKKGRSNGKGSNKHTLSSSSQYYIEKCNFLPDRISREKIKCPQCDKSFQTRAVKQVHMFKEHNIGELPYKCEECNKTFSSNAALKGHQNRNHLDKVHKCEFCERSFAVLPDLKHHMEMHTGHKPFICELCGKAFRTKTRMGYHKNAIHIKIRAFKCTMCPKDFLKSRDLKDHIKSHLNIRDKICETCGKGFTNSHALIRHRQLHAEVKKFACKFCEKRFYQFVGLNSHMKHRHGIYKNHPQRKIENKTENTEVAATSSQ